MRRTIATLLMLTLPFSNAAVPAETASTAATASSGPTTTTVVEYYNSQLDHYFITASDNEKAASTTAHSADGHAPAFEFEAYATKSPA